MDAKIYFNNLEALSKANPELFLKLSQIQENKKFNVSVSKDDPLGINIYDIESKIWMFQDPIVDTQKLITNFENYCRYPLIVLFGFGNGVFLKAILANNTHEHIYIIEPEIEILFIALHAFDFSEDIKSCRLRIMLTEDFESTYFKGCIVTDKVGTYLKTYNMSIGCPYYAKYTDIMVKINKIAINTILHFIKSHGNDATDSLIGIDHFLQNIPLMLKNYPFIYLVKQKNADVAVVVSTGPSLTKQLPLLKEIQNNVTIISVDASLPILEKWGIKPDIVTSIERVEDTALFFEKTSKEFQDGVVFVSSALQHKAVYDNIKAGQLVITMRPFGYMEMFSLTGYGYLGLGMSAANMAHELAYVMDYEKVILIGQDLAYGEDGMSHAKSHVYGEDEIKGHSSDSYITGWGGDKKVKTHDVWRMFLEFFVNGISESKGKMTTYNCTEGGARIDGSVEIRFAEAIRQLVNRNFIKKPIHLTKPDEGTMRELSKFAGGRYRYVFDFLKVQQKKIEKLFLEVAKECDKLEELNKTNELHKVDFKKVKKTLLKIDDFKDSMTDFMFKNAYWDAVQSYIINRELDVAQISVRHTKTKEEQEVKMTEFLFAHRAWLFAMAGGMNAVLEAFKKNQKTIIKKLEDYGNGK